MKTRLFYLCLLLISSISTNAQNFDDMVLEKRTPSIRDIIEVSSNLFTQYVSENKMDSARMILEYWEEKNGMSEPIFRAKLIYDLETNNFKESIFNEETIRLFHIYKNNFSYSRFELLSELTEGHDSQYSMKTGDILYPFNQFTTRRFDYLSAIYPSNSLENLICRYYKGEFTAFYDEILKDDRYKDLAIVKNANQEIKELNNRYEFDYAFIFGTWIPNGKIKTLGVHPEIGMSWGFKKRKFNADFYFLIRFLKAANNYTYLNENYQPTIGNNYFGGIIGMNLGYDIYSRGRNEFQLIGGIGADFIELQNENKKKSKENVEAVTLNLNIGFGYRYYFSNDHYLGLKVKYNFIDYSRSKHFDYSGNAVTVQLAWGVLFNWEKKAGLNHYGRKFRE